MRFVIVTGLSGAGKSQAMKSFEDLGFHCLDNLPPRLTGEIVTLCERAGIRRLALALDVRSHGPFGNAVAAVTELREREIAFELLYLEAGDDVIIRRYSETRRRHPYEHLGKNLADAIAAEHQEMTSLRAQADRVWDTSRLTQASLKARVVAAFADSDADTTLAVHVVAFGFKHGIPLDADLVFDVRFLPNPNYVPELKMLTGSDERVAAYLAPLPATMEFLRMLYGFIDFLIPQYTQEGRSRLTVAIGCTGGRHRSVFIAEELAEHLSGREHVEVTLEHRDLASAA
jgi:UPF0042 nucleotide-binding protein